MRKSHGMANTKVYKIWLMMRQRCHNLNSKDYKDYGARGINVCYEWLDSKYGFLNFYNWATSNGYKEGLSIDRIDTNGNYKPDNCRWITNREQQNNKRNTIYIDFENKKITLTELSEIYHIKRETLEMRYIRGDRGERLVRPVRKRVA